MELSNPVPQPEQIGEIFISLTAAASREIGGEYPTLSLTSTIYPRNLPLSPARSRPSAPACNPLTFPNCEAATLSWAIPTTNTDGTELAPTDISHFCIYFGLDADHMSLYTKLARTITQWTVSGLVDGLTYQLAVTCVSRSGVESFPAGQAADMSSAQVPEAVAVLDVEAFPGGGGVHPGLELSWSPVTMLMDGNPITTSISYVVYRGDSPGFTPDEAHRIATVPATSFVDSLLTNCTGACYLVKAKVCGNEGDPSPEVEAEYPAPPSFPTGIAGVASAQPGEVILTWNPPAVRVDSAPLDPEDISGYRVFVDSIPGNTTEYLEVTGAAGSTLITGLAQCTTYYFNVLCVDDCGHTGDFLAGNEVAVQTSAPCDDIPPDAPLALTIIPRTRRLDLEWPTVPGNCDLVQYRIYYGATSGGPYNGTGALEGNSPITVDATTVVQGDICRMSLNELGECQGYYAQVTALDVCDPPHESGPSPEAPGLTTCIACGVDAACTAWAVDGPSNSVLHLEIFTTNAGGETITRLTPEFNGAQQIREIWFGRPLTRIWSSDGASGEDGNIGPQPAGVELNVTDFNVTGGSSENDGRPFRVVFDSDIRDVPVDLAFRGYSGTCLASGRGTGASRIDDFTDRNYSGWTAVSGTWSATNGYAWQSATGNTYLMRDASLNLGDLTFEAKVQATGGTQHQAYLVFRYQDSNNYYVCGFSTETDQLKVQKIQNGSWAYTPTTFDHPFADGVWYTLRVVATGPRIQVWLDCTPVIDVTDPTIWSTGGLGFCTRKSRGGFDDVKIFAGTVLP